MSRQDLVIILLVVLLTLACFTQIYYFSEKNRLPDDIQREHNIKCDCVSRAHYRGYHTVEPSCHKYIKNYKPGECFI